MDLHVLRDSSQVQSWRGLENQAGEVCGQQA